MGLRKHKGSSMLTMSKVEEAYYYSLRAFIGTFVILVISACIRIEFPNEIVNSPFIGIKPIVTLFKAVDTPDFYLTNTVWYFHWCHLYW